MKKILVLSMFLLIILSGCDVLTALKASEIQSEINAFESGSNQFTYTSETKTTVHIGQARTIDRVKIEGKIQKDIEYYEHTLNNQTFVQQKIGDTVYSYTMNREDIINGIQFFNLTTRKLAEDETFNGPMTENKLDLNGIKISRDGDAYIFDGKAKDMLSDNDLAQIETIYQQSGIDLDELYEVPAKLSITILEDQMIQITEMAFDLDLVKIELLITFTMNYGEFTVRDFNDHRLYRQTNSQLPETIDLANPIYFRSSQGGFAYYNAYFEAGIYFVSTNTPQNLSSGISYDIYDNNRVSQRRFGIPINYDSDYLGAFFEIKSDGYYDMSFKYNLINFLYETRIIRTNYTNNGLQEIDSVFFNSGNIHYDIEGPYDFIGLQFNTTQKTLVILENTQALPFTNVYAISKTNKLLIEDGSETVYMYHKNGVIEGNLKVSYLPLENHATDYDDPRMKIMSSEYSLPLISTEAQIMKIVIEQKIEFRISFDYLYGRQNGIDIGIVNALTNEKTVYRYYQTITLLPGTYYFEPVYNENLVVYRVAFTPVTYFYD
ncbi:hypothetical protein N7548_00235 [Acholeplasma manati]|uniref:Lipoprotein n=1 Tax=Paracholeplasma manati TaxID=591373 RepID=A0ABT2Y465_9MOLU|nr:hypothetical protein [Paracholeplasma manati]MCV2231253.1 hypothetical protein [Paracholeplasma manati]